MPELGVAADADEPTDAVVVHRGARGLGRPGEHRVRDGRPGHVHVDDPAREIAGERPQALDREVAELLRGRLPQRVGDRTAEVDREHGLAGRREPRHGHRHLGHPEERQAAVREPGDRLGEVGPSLHVQLEEHHRPVPQVRERRQGGMAGEPTEHRRRERAHDRGARLLAAVDADPGDPAVGDGQALDRRTEADPVAEAGGEVVDHHVQAAARVDVPDVRGLRGLGAVADGHRPVREAAAHGEGDASRRGRPGSCRARSRTAHRPAGLTTPRAAGARSRRRGPGRTPRGTRRRHSAARDGSAAGCRVRSCCSAARA